MKKKILIYVPTKSNLKKTSKLGGIESLNYNLYLNLTKFNFEVEMINQIKDKHIKIYWDVIISSNDAKIFSIIKSKKNILWLHNILQIEKAFRKKQFFSIITNKITAVFVSNFLYNKTSFLYFFKKKIIINNFLDKNFIDINKNFNRKNIYIWSTRRDRGIDHLLECWINNFSLVKNSELHIFGIIQSSIYNKFSKKYLLKYNIFVHGFVDKKVLIKYYNISSGLICPGYDETFCLNAIEANACGVPVITFGLTNLRYLIKNNRNGYVVDNYVNIINKIAYINSLSNKERRKILINSYSYSRKYFPSRYISKWIKIIRSN